jgi:hypothetical protein
VADSNPHRGTLTKFLAVLVLGIAVTVATGVVYGRLSQRWGPVPDLTAAGKHLATFPPQFGDWLLVADEPISDAILQTLSCAGYVNRSYVHQQTGEKVDLTITVGPSGPISVHTPEICYSSRAYTIQDSRKRTTLPDDDGQTHTFWKLTFRSNDATIDQLRVYYGWCADGGWTASESPRFEFAGRPRLFKLQIASLMPATQADRGEDPCERFLMALLRSGWRVTGQRGNKLAAAS